MAKKKVNNGATNSKKSVDKNTMKNALSKAYMTANEKDPRVKSDRVVRTGVIKFMDIRKGYGFIVDSETGEDVFFHHTGIQSGRTYKGYMPEDEVSYCVGPTDRGPEAFEINMEKASTRYHRKKTYQQEAEEDAGELPEGIEEDDEEEEESEEVDDEDDDSEDSEDEDDEAEEEDEADEADEESEE